MNRRRFLGAVTAMGIGGAGGLTGAGCAMASPGPARQRTGGGAGFTDLVILLGSWGDIDLEVEYLLEILGRAG